VVVSPLIALMQDQVEGLRQAGVRAAALNSSLEASEASAVWRALERGELDLLYVSPERLLSPGFLDRLEQLPLALFAIDEAHCVSQWGHDFRPEYLQLAVLAERFAAIPRLALTATADPRTREEIRERLRLQEGRVFLASFDRPNIRYLLRDKDEARSQLLAFLAERRGEAGIVYARSRSRVDRFAADLRAAGFDAVAYHAGLSPQQLARRPPHLPPPPLPLAPPPPQPHWAMVMPVGRRPGYPHCTRRWCAMHTVPGAATAPARRTGPRGRPQPRVASSRRGWVAAPGAGKAAGTASA
jgi:ATP-dependent DNA helicase RecQ